MLRPLLIIITIGFNLNSTYALRTVFSLGLGPGPWMGIKLQQGLDTLEEDTKRYFKNKFTELDKCKNPKSSECLFPVRCTFRAALPFDHPQFGSDVKIGMADGPDFIAPMLTDSPDVFKILGRGFDSTGAPNLMEVAKFADSFDLKREGISDVLVYAQQGGCHQVDHWFGFVFEDNNPATKHIYYLDKVATFLKATDNKVALWMRKLILQVIPSRDLPNLSEVGYSGKKELECWEAGDEYSSGCSIYHENRAQDFELLNQFAQNKTKANFQAWAKIARADNLHIFITRDTSGSVEVVLHRTKFFRSKVYPYDFQGEEKEWAEHFKGILPSGPYMPSSCSGLTYKTQTLKQFTDCKESR